MPSSSRSTTGLFASAFATVGEPHSVADTTPSIVGSAFFANWSASTVANFSSANTVKDDIVRSVATTKKIEIIFFIFPPEVKIFYFLYSYYNK